MLAEMTELQGWALVISAIGSLLGVVFAGVAAVFAALAKWQSNRNSVEIDRVSQQTDGLTRALVKSEKKASFAPGGAAERANPGEANVPPESAVLVKPFVPDPPTPTN